MCQRSFSSVRASRLASANPASLSSSETGVNLGIKSWKKRLSESAQCQEAISCIYFTKKTWRPEGLQPGLEIGKSQPRSEVDIFEGISWLNDSEYGGKYRGFLKEGVKTNMMASMSPLNSSPFFIVTSIVYGFVRGLQSANADLWLGREMPLHELLKLILHLHQRSNSLQRSQTPQSTRGIRPENNAKDVKYAVDIGRLINVEIH